MNNDEDEDEENKDCECSRCKEMFTSSSGYWMPGEDDKGRSEHYFYCEVCFGDD